MSKGVPAASLLLIILICVPAANQYGLLAVLAGTFRKFRVFRPVCANQCRSTHLPCPPNCVQTTHPLRTQGRPALTSKSGSVEIPDDPELEVDLTGPEYGFSSKNQIQLERKEDIKRRGLASPDLRRLSGHDLRRRYCIPQAASLTACLSLSLAECVDGINLAACRNGLLEVSGTGPTLSADRAVIWTQLGGHGKPVDRHCLAHTRTKTRELSESARQDGVFFLEYSRIQPGLLFGRTVNTKVTVRRKKGKLHKDLRRKDNRPHRTAAARSPRLT